MTLLSTLLAAVVLGTGNCSFKIVHRSVHKKNCIVSERKGIRAVCVLTTPLFSQVRSQKNGHNFLFCFWQLIFSSHESKRCWTVHRDQRTNCYSVAIRAKQSGTVKAVEHSKNDYVAYVPSKYRRTDTVETLTPSGRKKSFTNRERNAFKRLVKSNGRLILKNIVKGLNPGVISKGWVWSSGWT